MDNHIVSLNDVLIHEWSVVFFVFVQTLYIWVGISDFLHNKIYAQSFFSSLFLEKLANPLYIFIKFFVHLNTYLSNNILSAKHIMWFIISLSEYLNLWPKHRTNIILHAFLKLLISLGSLSNICWIKFPNQYFSFIWFIVYGFI